MTTPSRSTSAGTSVADFDHRNHLPLLFEQLADALGDTPALVQGDRVVSWAGFDSRSARLAAVLAGLGLPEGAVVAIDLYNCPEYFEVFHAALKASLVPANVNYRYVDDELVSLLVGCRTSVLVYDAAMRQQVARVRPRLEQIRLFVEVDHSGGPPTPDGVVGYEQALAGAAELPRRPLGDGFYLSFTGGTTGLPKGVMFNVARATVNGFGLRDLFLGRTGTPGEDPIDVALALRAEQQSPVTLPASPLMHSTGLIFVSLPTLQAGGTVVLTESRSFDAHELWRVVARQRVSVIGIVGDAFAIPMQSALDEADAAGAPYDTSCLRIVCSAGVAWSAHVKRQLVERVPDVRLVDACGSTEGATYGMRIGSDPDRLATANFDPMPGVMVLAPDGGPAAPGVVGLLASPTPCDGYYLDQERTAAVFREIDGVRYTVPGDLGRIEPDGSLTLIGRGTSTINTGGEKVHPEEVEQAIKELPDVADAIVLGLPDARFGTVVAAVVAPVAAGSVSDRLVVDSVRRRLAGYKVPRRVLIVERVPRLPNGKPDFPEATAMLLAAEAPRPETSEEASP